MGYRVSKETFSSSEVARAPFDQHQESWPLGRPIFGVSDCQTWLWACAEWREARELQTSGDGPSQSSILSADQKERGIWGWDYKSNKMTWQNKIKPSLPLYNDSSRLWFLFLKAQEEFNYLPKVALAVTRILRFLFHSREQVLPLANLQRLYFWFPILTESGRALTTIRHATPTTKTKIASSLKIFTIDWYPFPRLIWPP